MVTQKATAICIYEILKKYSDENHAISADKIREKLKTIYDVDMERRAIYRNIEALCSVGIEIADFHDTREGYYLIDRQFEASEARLLCDAVAASEIIKPEDSQAIMKKLIDTQSIFQGRMLQKTVFVKAEKQMVNRQLFYNIDALNIAISQGCKVCVKLMEYGWEQELRMKKNGLVVFSPYTTIWVEGNYYVLVRREGEESLEHLRIDRMQDITILERGVDMIFGGFNPEQYAKQYITQNNEPQERFEMECDKELWQELVEVFGKDAVVINNGYPALAVRVVTNASKMRNWALAHIDTCEIKKPRKFRDEIQSVVYDAYKKYWG